MERLEHLCKVLGSNLQEKHDEIGIIHGQEPDDEARSLLEKNVHVLEASAASRFAKLQDIGSQLTDLWMFHHTPSVEILNFVDIFACIDAKSPNELTQEMSLSVGLINKVSKEIDALEALKVEKLKNEYLSEKKKLLKLLKQSRRIPSEFDFDPKIKVESNFPNATTHIKDLIEQVESQAVDRKEIVMRTQILLQAVNSSFPVKTTESLLQSLKNLVVLKQKFLFDGKDIKVLLKDIEAKIQTPSANSVLPPRKRASTRLKNQENAEGGNRELPVPPYPSGPRAGNWIPRKDTWGKGKGVDR